MITINSDALSRPDPSEHYLKVRHYLSNDNENVSIVVQAFGRADKTKTCIECILKYTEPGYKLYILDNGTPDDSIIDLYNSIEYKNKELIRYTKNITGVYAINKVLHFLTTDYIAWVNNDIVVTTNWLSNMMTCMKSDDSIGMIVPVSANTSNLQGEDLGGFANFTEMQRKAAIYNKSDPKKWEERIRLIPTATLYRREIFDVVGLYDTGFMHDFGDDDFTFRVRRAGYKLIVCTDTFVHHDHPPKDLTAEREKIMEESRVFFKEKHHGVEAWRDSNNYIFQHLEDAEIKNTESNSLIAFDVRCGTPILDIKNTYRKQGYKTGHIKAVTSDPKYYTDLISVSDEVICKDIEQAIMEETEQYDFIVLGSPINDFTNPNSLLVKLATMRRETGYLVFPIRNSYDITTLFKSLNMSFEAGMDFFRKYTYQDAYNQLKEFGRCKHVIVKPVFFSIDQPLIDKAQSIINNISDVKDKDDVMTQLNTKEYWIVVS